MRNLSKFSVFLVTFIAFTFATPAFATDATGYVKSAARSHGVPVNFALKIAKIESGAKCGVHNHSSGATGPMQILPSTARKIGFRNIRSASCATQVNAGMKYLKFCIKHAHGNLYNAARCYNGGPGGMKTRNKSIHKYAAKATR